MPNSHDLKGLMKFLSRDEWRDCFEDVLDDHFGPVLDASNMEFDDLAEMLGDHWAMTLWGCAFEDFLTQDFDVEGGNIVDEYLKRRGWKEGAQAKAYMKALRASVMSLYEVSDIVPGKSLMARDLIRGGDPVLVSEGTATKTLQQWGRVAARIVPVAGKNIIGGGLLPFTPEASDALFDGLRAIFGKGRSKKLPVPTNEELQQAAPVFTLSWLFDTLDRTMRMEQTTFENGDGDAIIFHDVRFPLASGITQKEITAQLKTVPALRQENAKFWNWLGDTPTGRLKAGKSGNLAWDTTMEDGARVLGNVEMKGRTLHLSTNSAARAEKGTALLQGALNDLVGRPLTEIRTVEQMMAERPVRDKDTAGPELPPEIATKVVHEFLDKQYRETLDQPVGMLGNISPREAIKTANGREKAAEWLKYLENRSSSQPDPNDPMATYNFRWIWAELGIENLRR